MGGLDNWTSYPDISCFFHAIPRARLVYRQRAVCTSCGYRCWTRSAECAECWCLARGRVDNASRSHVVFVQSWNSPPDVMVSSKNAYQKVGAPYDGSNDRQRTNVD